MSKQAAGGPWALSDNVLDLAPREAMAAWLTDLRKSHPTFLFRGSSTYLPADPLKSPSKTKIQLSHSDALGREVLIQALHTIADANKLSELSVVVVGVTNVSSAINSMLD